MHTVRWFVVAGVAEVDVQLVLFTVGPIGPTEHMMFLRGAIFAAHVALIFFSVHAVTFVSSSR